MIKFISKLFKFSFTLFIAFIIFIYIFSLKGNMSFEDTIAYFKTIISNSLDIENSENVIANSNVDITPTVTSSNNHYYYEQLNDYAKIIYNSLESNIDNLKKENYSIDFSTTFNELLNKTTGKYTLNKAFQSALDAFFYDHPELFYLNLTNFSLNTTCVSIGPLKTYSAEIVPKGNTYLHANFNSEQEVEIAIKQVENIKNDIIANVSDYNIYDKIKYVHDTLVNNLEYDINFTQKNIYNIYGALIEKKAVCEGYAKAFKYILDGLNIECILVTGTASNNSGETELHMWNYVKLNDDWYGVDVTWDDPVINGGTYKNNLRRTYFLKGYYTFKENHISSGKISDSGMLFTLPSLSTKNYR